MTTTIQERSANDSVTILRCHLETLTACAEQPDEDPTYHGECCVDCGWEEPPTGYDARVQNVDKHKPNCAKRAAVVAAREALGS